MSRLDIVIFGATGFTGQKAVEEVARGGKDYDTLTWGVAGRSQDKLESLIKEVSKKTDRDLSKVKLIVADVKDEKSLKEMCSQTKVLVNCCGPYRLYGEPVVRAAIDAKTHYVDVSGEPEFIETMQLEYNAQAQDAGVYIISACGFDSIPNDMGVVYLQQNWEGTLNSVESYLSTYVSPEYSKEAVKSGTINYGTWESLVYGLANSNKLPALRKKLFPEKMPSYKPKLLPRGALHQWGGGYCLPFPGSDNSIVYRSQRGRYEAGYRPVQFRAYVKFSSLMETVLLAFVGVLLYAMTRTKCTTKLLLNYPRFFSGGMVTKEGPKEEVINNTHFEFQLVGKGWQKDDDIEATAPNKTIIGKVSGVNPGYGATVVALLHSALTILREKEKMPGNGGVLTTALAFWDTTLIRRLNENNLKFEIVEKK
ncbi:saccharopine dehydrogenase-like oxidoreductase [Achroia grisella]|uniref:saccharopine dehydrogenase-like oxidoreductase n=1 Tax=Achroia grisella TaxID=688607 RepID=UPI0027D23D51|nr:saccharopine dehydrogenase-like oxidoreductase [Achroia grisella]XP_059061508.1 saccharopine dehydrogenase-like oxidoreductase [Achroia grisella]